MQGILEQLTAKEAKPLECAQQKGSSAWLTCRPKQELGYSLNKREFTDALCLRYGWPITDTPKMCACGSANGIDHALSCLKGGYSHMRHNAIRDLEADLMGEVCVDVKIEPELIPVGDVQLAAGTTIQDQAKLDVSGIGLWRAHERTFCDVRITHPHAPSYTKKSLETVLKTAEKEKITKYNDRVLQIEKGSFVPLVFATNGAMGRQCENFHKQVAKLISEKRGESYSSVMTHIRTRLRIALLKCVLIAIRGYRGPVKKNGDSLLPMCEIDFGLIQLDS